MSNRAVARRLGWALGLTSLGLMLGCQSQAALPTQSPAEAAPAPTERRVMQLNPLVLPHPASGLPVYDPSRNTVVQFPGIPAHARTPVLIPGGRFVGFRDHQGVGFYDVKTKMIKRFPHLDVDPRHIRHFDYTEDGHFTYTDPRGVHVVTRRGEDYLVPGATRILAAPIRNVTLSPNGRFMFYGSGGGVFVSDLRTGRQLTVPHTAGMLGARVFDVSADGRSMLIWQGGVLKVLDLRTGWAVNLSLIPGPVLDARLAPGGNVVFVRNGRLLSYNQRTGLLDTMPIENRRLYGL